MCSRFSKSWYSVCRSLVLTLMTLQCSFSAFENSHFGIPWLLVHHFLILSYSQYPKYRSTYFSATHPPCSFRVFGFHIWNFMILVAKPLLHGNSGTQNTKNAPFLLGLLSWCLDHCHLSFIWMIPILFSLWDSMTPTTLILWSPELLVSKILVVPRYSPRVPHGWMTLIIFRDFSNCEVKRLSRDLLPNVRIPAMKDFVTRVLPRWMAQIYSGLLDPWVIISQSTVLWTSELSNFWNLKSRCSYPVETFLDSLLCMWGLNLMLLSTDLRAIGCPEQDLMAQI
jgi:hypothetical protein